MKQTKDKIDNYLLTNIGKHPQDIVAKAAKHFSVARMTIHRHLSKLAQHKQIIKAGSGRQMSYFLTTEFNKSLNLKLSADLNEFDVWADNFETAFQILKKNVFDICEYGFLEMLNNVIDHSNAKNVWLASNMQNSMITIHILDNGIGIFSKIKQAFDLENERESILALSKGKLTTDPKNHTGEGIFFSSRAFDKFTIAANGLEYTKDNLLDDWFIECQDNLKQPGTLIIMSIQLDSDRILKNIFDTYTNPDSYAFNKTHIRVELSKLGNERYVSRSQAKRLLIGLDKFQHIILDFKNVATVGQGFVDEVFRIYKNRHSDITIDYINANEDVEFMIKRGIQ